VKSVCLAFSDHSGYLWRAVLYALYAIAKGRAHDTAARMISAATTSTPTASSRRVAVDSVAADGSSARCASVRPPRQRYQRWQRRGGQARGAAADTRGRGDVANTSRAGASSKRGKASAAAYKQTAPRRLSTLCRGGRLRAGRCSEYTARRRVQRRGKASAAANRLALPQQAAAGGDRTGRRRSWWQGGSVTARVAKCFVLGKGGLGGHREYVRLSTSEIERPFGAQPAKSSVRSALNQRN
jgi:hypothetical protein